jgi:hypothetical protein
MSLTVTQTITLDGVIDAARAFRRFPATRP